MPMHLVNNRNPMTDILSTISRGKRPQRIFALMAKKAKALGQVAHERSDASDLGTKLHLANVEGPEILSPREREDWETCQRKRAAFLTPMDQRSRAPGSGRLICGAAREQAEQVMLAKVVELPLGEQAARLLDDIKRAQALFKEVEAYYKRVLEEQPGAIPGWMLAPGDVRRSIPDTAQALQRTEGLFSFLEFLQCCSLSVPELERAWAKKNNVPAAKARAQFSRALARVIVEKRNAPSLKPTT
jgi:hypothetical protein